MQLISIQSSFNSLQVEYKQCSLSYLPAPQKCVSIPYRQSTNFAAVAAMSKQNAVSIPYRQSTNSPDVLKKSRKDVVSIPYRQSTNALRLYLLPNHEHVSIPYRQSTNLYALAGLAGLYLVSIPYRQSTNALSVLLYLQLLKSFNSLQVEYKQVLKKLREKEKEVSIPYRQSTNNHRGTSKVLHSKFQFLIGRVQTYRRSVNNSGI